MKPSKTKLAVFDIDGTLFRWQLFHELVSELTLAQVFPQNTYREIDDAWQRWRGGELAFGEYEAMVVKTLVEYLPLISVPILETAAKKVVTQSGHKVHYYTHELLKKLQKEGYRTLAISGSQQELLDLFASKYHFDDWIGVLYERKDDHYTGKITRETYGNKAKLLEDYLLSHPDITLEDSVGIGDSGGDIELLGMVDHPIAFNPSEELFEEAQNKGWEVVIERKNVSYRMEHQDGRFLLAETIIY